MNKFKSEIDFRVKATIDRNGIVNSQVSIDADATPEEVVGIVIEGLKTILADKDFTIEEILAKLDVIDFGKINEKIEEIEEITNEANDLSEKIEKILEKEMFKDADFLKRFADFISKEI